MSLKFEEGNFIICWVFTNLPKRLLSKLISQDTYSYTQIINKWHIGVSMAYFYGLNCSNTSKIKVFTGVKGVYLVMLIMFIR